MRSANRAVRAALIRLLKAVINLWLAFKSCGYRILGPKTEAGLQLALLAIDARKTTDDEG